MDEYYEEEEDEDEDYLYEEVGNQEREMWELRRQRELKKACEDSPIRTRYNPKDRSPPKSTSGRNISKGSRPSNTTSGTSSGSGLRSSSADSPAGRRRLVRAQAAAGRLTQTARSWAARGGKELHIARASLGDAASHAYRSLNGEGADLTAIELFERAHRVPVDADHTHFGVDHHAQRQEEVKQGVVALRQEFGLSHSEPPYNAMKRNGMYFSGIDDAVMRAAQTRDQRDRERKVLDKPNLMKNDRLRALQSGKHFDSAGSSMRKQAVPAGALEELWSAMPGDSAIRRQPEEHEAVFDFGDNRISMPRYFAEDLRYGEEKREAGQLIEVKSRFTPNGEAGIVTLTTHVARRNCIPSAPDRLDAICNTAQFDVDAPKADPKKRGLMGTSYSHLHQTKRPPDNKEWMAWREIQAQKRMEAIKEKESSVARARRGQLGHFDDEPDDPEEEGTGFEDQAAQQEADAATSPTSAGSSAATPGAAGSPLRRRGGIDARSAAQHTLLPWDARPPPHAEEMERIARKILPRAQAEAHRRRAAKVREKKSEQPKELHWTLKAVGSMEFELEFAVKLDPEAGIFFRPHQAPKKSDSQGEEESQDSWDDEDFWQGVFEPVPKAKEVRRSCWGVCGC